MDSEENPLIHKQGRLASAKPGSKPIGLLHLVYLGEKSVLHSSSNLGVPEGQTDERVGHYTSRNATCHVQLISRQIEGRSQEQRELY